MNPAATIALFDQQYLTREGMERLLEQEQWVSGFRSFSNPAGFTQHLAADQPTLAIISLSEVEAPHWEEQLDQLQARTALLVLCDQLPANRLKNWAEAGVQGFASKHSPREELILALKRVSQGQRYYSQELFDSLLPIAQIQPGQVGQLSPLSQREQEVLAHIVKGKSTQEIASMLSISVHTVSSHRKNILRKLHLKSPVQLIAYALEHGLAKL